MNRLEIALEFLHAQSTLALATVDPDGAPRVTPLFYFLAGPAGDAETAPGGIRFSRPGSIPRLYWFSSRGSAHSRNVKSVPAAAAAVYAPAEDWRKIRGVQMRGKAWNVVDRAERREVSEAYIARFHLGRLFDAAISRSGLYAFEPDWLRYIDNSNRFGYKFEIRLAGFRTV